eukprot:TRINITY_DN4988_c0_g1_i10.p1 TRINITY_DN4988_c0_g1~~TRINITY_DN4988_c0_g1_i10.p1  ORF type:complete len:153 (-),score=25.95 TRINITY_DN4988_c0_g1_i10:344-802(-)
MLRFPQFLEFIKHRCVFQNEVVIRPFLPQKPKFDHKQTVHSLSKAMSLFDEVDDEFKLLVCAAYGDLDGINSFTGNSPIYDVDALMVAMANNQTNAANQLKAKYPNLATKTTNCQFIWRLATHSRNSSPVYLPLTVILIHISISHEFLSLFI